jgi:hypothetical protein
MNPSYDEALKQYYENGPRTDWQPQFVSAYATMHPWEDFAETFATYLDMVSTLDTAYHVGLLATPPPLQDLNAVMVQYQQVGVALNELNRSMGLLDVVPEVLTPGVKGKMEFVDHVTVAGASRNAEQIAVAPTADRDAPSRARQPGARELLPHDRSAVARGRSLRTVEDQSL